MARFSPVVVDHFTNPRRAGEVADANLRVFIGNPVCGDQILLTAVVRLDVVDDVRFQAFGCSPSLAAASLLTDVVAGQNLSTLADVDATRIEELLGGLAPDHRHAAVLAADAAHRLVDNYRNGVSDHEPVDPRA